MMHLNRINILFVCAIVVPVLAGCTKKVEKIDYVAKVNDTYLTKNDLALIADTTELRTRKEEVIRNWILKEMLFQEAKKEGIVDAAAFKNQIENSKKELAGSLLLQYFSESQKINASERDLKDYYETNNLEFKLSYNAYYINIIRFDDYDKAVQFRSYLLENGWEKAVAEFRDDQSIIRIRTAVTVNEQDLYPIKLSRLVQALQPQEISIVISEDSGYHSVVQVLDKFPKDSIPPFEAIKNVVVERYKAGKLKELINKYIDDLYTKNHVDINF
jgi:peptidyl-prolyl cis-trans isomerase C